MKHCWTQVEVVERANERFLTRTGSFVWKLTRRCWLFLESEFCVVKDDPRIDCVMSKPWDEASLNASVPPCSGDGFVRGRLFLCCDYSRHSETGPEWHEGGKQYVFKYYILCSYYILLYILYTVFTRWIGIKKRFLDKNTKYKNPPIEKRRDADELLNAD